MPVKKTNKTVVGKKTTKVVASKPAATAKKPVMKKPAVTKVATVSAAPSLAKKVDGKKISPKKLIKPLIFLLILASVYLLKDEVVVASVNGRPVTRFALIRNLEKQAGSSTLENMTLQMLVEQELKKAGVAVTDEEMDAEIATIEGQLSAQGQSLDDLLAAQNMTRDDIKEQLSLTKGLEKLLADKITVSDDEIKAYFESNKEAIGTDVALADVSENIKSQLKQEKLITEEQKWFAEIKKTAKVNYYKFAPISNL